MSSARQRQITWLSLQLMSQILPNGIVNSRRGGKIMVCHFCKGTMQKGKTSYTVNRKGYHLVIDEVPAYICDQCKEPYFDEPGVRLVQELIRDLDRRAEALQSVAV